MKTRLFGIIGALALGFILSVGAVAQPQDQPVVGNKVVGPDGRTEVDRENFLSPRTGADLPIERPESNLVVPEERRDVLSVPTPLPGRTETPSKPVVDDSLNYQLGIEPADATVPEPINDRVASER